MIRIGILTWNGLSHTMRCLDSLLAHTHSPFMVLVRDNASTDETSAYLQSLTDPRIRVHVGRENLGVSGGRNWLLDALLPDMQDDELLVLLDNDIEVSAGWETPFVTAFQEQPRLGVAGRWAFSMLVHDGWRDILAEHGGASGPVDTVQGCTFWLRAAAARTVGRFDESLGRFWHEDDDYSIRALHAGWDVQRVAGDGIVHHEHGSGVATDPLKRDGSLRNQATLTAKWRAMGAIDAHGVPRRSVPEPHAAALARMSARLGRPVLRTEFNSALVDTTLLLHAPLTDERVATLAAPVAQLLLQESVTHGGAVARRATVALDRIATVRSARRGVGDAGGRAVAPDGAPPIGRAFSAVCDPAAWDDARWAGTYRDWLRDGAGADFYARSETGWRDGQLLHALRTLGAARRDARVLLLGHASERLITALSHQVAHLTVADHEAPTSALLAASTARTLGAAVLEATSWKAIARDASARASFDVVVCPNGSRFAPAAEFAPWLSRLATLARSGAIVATAVSVRIAGPADGRWVELAQLADDATLSRIGLSRVGAFDHRVPDATLLAAVPDGSHGAVRPRLARFVAPHCVSLATLVARRR